MRCPIKKYTNHVITKRKKGVREKREVAHNGTNLKSVLFLFEIRRLDNLTVRAAHPHLSAEIVVKRRMCVLGLLCHPDLADVLTHSYYIDAPIIIMIVRDGSRLRFFIHGIRCILTF